MSRFAGWCLWLLLLGCSDDGGKLDGPRLDAADGSTVDLYYRGDGACRPGDSAGCMSIEGKPALKICELGRWSACVYECSPGAVRTCTGGKQACQNGKWGPCTPG